MMGVGDTAIWRNHWSECTDCMTPTSAIAAFGAVVGAATGRLVGWLVYLARSSTPRRIEHALARATCRGQGPNVRCV